MTTTNWTGVETGLGVAGGSVRGARRDHNEDAFGAQQPRDATEATARGSLFVVADGVGGRNGGEIASSLAVDFLLEEYFAHPGADPLQALEAACLLANAEIVDRAAGNPNLNGMATTLVAAAVRDLDLFIAHVGDSRAYRLRGRRLERLTADHTLAAEAPGLDGTASQDSALGARITRFLGSPAGVRPELQRHRLEPGDVLMLCSDGLTDAISEPELASTLRSRSPDEAVRRLLVRSREQGARDDHTVVVARIPAAERAVLAAPRMPVPGPEVEESVAVETRPARRSVTPTELIPVATPAADTVADEPMAADEAANSMIFPERAPRFEPRPSPLHPAWQSPVVKWLVVPVALFVALVTGLQVAYVGRVVPGVTIAGAPVGGLSKADLERVVNERFTEYSASRIVLQVPNKQWRYTPAELGWRRDVVGTVETALTIGHSANPVVRLREQADAFVFGREISPAASVDDSRLAAVARSLAAEIDQPARDAALVLDPDLRLRVEASQSERKLDQAAAARDIRQQLAQLRPGTIALAVREQPARLRDGDVEGARAEAERILRAPIVLRNGEQRWELDRKRLGELLTIATPSPTAGQSKVTAQLDEARLTALVKKIAGEIDRPARSARFNYVDGQLRVTQESVTGQTLDVGAATAAIRSAATGDEREVALPVALNAPKVASSDAAKIRVDGAVEVAVTDYGGTVAERTHNVELAASRLNGIVLAPGELFSFNQSLGSTALENGYKIGWGIAGDGAQLRTVPSVAGGICQVATTLFQAVFWAGYQIEERNYHLYWIPRYGQPPKGLKGLDATVDEEGNVDLKFVNNSPNYLLIQSSADRARGRLTFTLYGVKPAWQVKVDGPQVDQPLRADQSVVRQPDPTMAVGRELKVESAEDGFRSTIVRTVIDGSAQPRVLRLTSTYKPSRNVVLIGTKRG